MADNQDAEKTTLKSFNLYAFLKQQDTDGHQAPYFLADEQTYNSARVNFPFRTSTYGLGVTYSGKGDMFSIGSTDYLVGPGCLTTIGPGLVCQWTGSYSAEHDTVYFTDELFNEMQSSSFLHALPFFFHGGKHVINLTDEQTNQMVLLFNMLKEFKHQAKVVPGIVYALLMLTDSFHNELNGQLKNSTPSNGEKITNAFRKLVAAHFPEHKAVSYYADALHITPKYLSEVLQAELGKAAKTFIDEYVMMEAKSLLKQTSLSIQEIGYWLGFEDASHFSKSFKKFTDTTPSEYRRR